MERISVNEIVQAVGGRLLCGDGETEIWNVAIDSREAKEGSLFVPIVGERVDAHRFMAQVFEQGASASLTSTGEVTDETKAHILVENTVKAIGDLASYYRNKFHIPVVGITGSVGKTSTKEMIAAALSAKFNVLKTAGNQNSQIGVPLTLFRIEKQHEIAVIEMGVSEFGEMDRLADIVRPDMAVMTNIGEAHIANFGEKKNTLSEKIKIAKHFSDDQVLFMNGDDPLLKEAATKASCKTVVFGTEDENCDYYGENIHIQDGKNQFDLRCSGGTEEITIAQIGLHNVLNALVAVAVAKAYGIDPKDAKKTMAQYQGIAMRQQINHLAEGIKVIDDTYNASPASIKAAIDVLMQLDNKGRKIAVLADVLELGERSYELHYGIGEHICELKPTLDMVITVGEEMKALVKAVKDQGLDIIAVSMENNAAAIAYLQENIQSGDAILVKGSRGMHEEEVVKAIVELKK